MPVRIITDASSCLPESIAADLDITVLPIHQVTVDEETTTAGLTALELAAAYGREMQKGVDPATGKDCGVVAIHLAKELSSTWSAAVTAAGVFDGAVRVVDTDSVGMVLGEAAMAAARAAQAGADVDECARIASLVTGRSHLWLYVTKVDALRKSGRMSTGSAMLTTLPFKPIFALTNGAFSVASRTRTQAKALERLVELVIETAGGEVAYVAVHHSEADAVARDVADQLRAALASGSKVMEVELSPALKVHTGPGAVAVSLYVPAAGDPDDGGVDNSGLG